MTYVSPTRASFGLFRLAACALAASALAACVPVAPLPSGAPSSTLSSTLAPAPSPVPSLTLQPTPTQVPTPTPLTTITEETDIGSVTLAIPVPLLPPGVEVRVESRPAEEAPRDLRDAGVRQPYHLLLPQDLAFASPVRVSVAIPTRKFTRDDGSIAIAYLAIRAPDGTWEWLGSADMSISAEVTVISGTTTHFGALFAWSDLTDMVRIPEQIGSYAVGEVFRPLVGISPREPRDHPVAYVTPPQFHNLDPAVIEVGQPLSTITYREWRCLAVGDYTVTFDAWLTNFGADNPFLSATLVLPPTEGTLAYDMTGSCVIPLRPTPNPTPNSSPSSSP